MNKQKFIWLFGENNSRTHNNNSFYFWDHVWNKDDEIEKYFILVKNAQNMAFVKTLPLLKQKYIVWRNSLKHLLLYQNADMFFVTLSYDDVTPNKIMHKSIKFKTKRPVIYLQHGTLGIKKIGYQGNHYNNNMFRFVIYNKLIKKQYALENNFKDYQLYYSEYHPRYKALITKQKEYLKSANRERQILFFMTWRDYFGDNFATKYLIKNINDILTNRKLLNYLKDTNTKLVLGLHQFFHGDQLSKLTQNTDPQYIKVAYSSEMDIMDELTKSDLLITDYSSLGFDFSFLNKPVILYEPDLYDYLKSRKLYCTIKELEKYAIQDANTLIKTIIKGKYKLNDFFLKRLPENIDYDYVEKGFHIDKMYNYFKHLQLNRITILGYNFSGKGGTVSATKALAEALLEKDYLVELLSLKITEKNFGLPYGLALNAFYNRYQNKWKNRFKRHFYQNQKHLEYFKYDLNQKYLFPYIGYSLKKYLKKCQSNTLISTRESIHLFVKKYASANVKNKLYFFHTDSSVINDYYPGLMDEIKKETLENVIFVTENSKQAYQTKFDYHHYDKSWVIGNCLTSDSMIEKKYIKINKTRKEIVCAVLMRLSADRQNDILNIINFGKYLLKQAHNKVIINVYGAGDLVSQLENLILSNNLKGIVNYCGLATSSKKVIINSDCVIDFCNNQSFGMIYIESIFNGKPVFAKENVGSNEVLKDIPNSIYHSNEELLNLLLGIKKQNVDVYKNNYEILNKVYSRNVVARKVIKILNNK